MKNYGWLTSIFLGVSLMGALMQLDLERDRAKLWQHRAEVYHEQLLSVQSTNSEARWLDPSNDSFRAWYYQWRAGQK